jgi:hypothetical protein
MLTKMGQKARVEAVLRFAPRKVVLGIEAMES